VWAGSAGVGALQVSSDNVRIVVDVASQGGDMKTNLYSVLCATVRLGAVLMAVGLVEQWPGLIAPRSGQITLSAIALDLLGLIVAFVLWLRPGLLAWWAASSSQREVFETRISATQLQYIAFSVAGMYKLITGIEGMVAHGLNLLAYNRMATDGVPFVAPSYEKTLFIEYAVAAVAGLALTLGARGLAGVLHRIRNAGHPGPSAMEDVSQG
jgi:hypothetical protein